MKRKWIFLFLIIMPVILVSAQGIVDSSSIYEDIAAAEFKEGIDKGGFLLDVRTPQEFNQAHIPGATLIPLQELSSRWVEIEDYKDQAVYVYCRSGNRSRSAVTILQKQGFKEIYNLNRGIGEWVSSGFPVE